MPSPNSPSPWKVLILALVACTVCLMLAVGGGLYWFLSKTGLHRGKTERPATQQHENLPRNAAPAPADKQADAAATNTPFPPDATNEPSLAQTHSGTKTQSSAPKSKSVVPNAILASKSGAGRQAGDDLFKDIVVPNLELDIPAEAVVRLTVSPRTYVRVDIREGERLYTNVAIRLKGGPGSFQRLHDTPSFTVNFDKFAPGQTFHGLKKIHLNSSVQDRTFLNEQISRELFEAAGVPVPRAGHAIVAINRRDPRLYVVLEGVNKQFLKRYFKDAEGNVYDGHSGTDVTNKLPVNTGEEDLSRLRDLAGAAREPDLDVRLTKLEQTLDIDRFLSFVALEMMLTHWDGYTMARNNYRIAHDRDTDRMVFVPHGMDQVLGNPRQQLLSPAPAGLVARSVLQIPEMRKRYRDRVADLTTNVFRVSSITNRIWEVAEKVAAALEEVDPATAKSYRDRIAPAVCKKVRQRATDLIREINPGELPASVKFDRSASASLTNWTAKTDVGEARLTHEKDESGNIFLYIGTTSGCTASWRTLTTLDQGKYRFEARVRTKGVVIDPADPRAGAGLRISRHRNGQKNAGDRDWFQVTFEFDVQHDGDEKELICELRADQGEIWYDLKSLKLRQIQ
jgi:spore coat protein H